MDRITKKASAIKHVCIHGHFYQPPRDNPWLEAIEREESAAPYHDWNERINAECYRANTAARLVDDKNRILRLHNNYNSLSFNFGPTLLRWIEQNDPWVYRKIIESDRESCSRLDGHGNAIAQIYNHVIMPLANLRDKVTQVKWGIRDFEHRFGRAPEGMWLAETAVDRETLRVMAQEGIKFTILSPLQASRWRFLRKADAWCDASGGTIPTGRAYRYDCGGGFNIQIFFYDSALARGIAFERLLEHSSRMIHSIDANFARTDRPRGEPWLINTATDGESYGHHFKFGDMALAAAFLELERDPNTRITNYAAFLASFPVRAEVEIIENSAWSCAHGLGRWQADCGCNMGGGPGWNQKWRAPLREALNVLRDDLASHYEKEMTELVKDPWHTRDEYIEVLLDPEKRSSDFLAKHTRKNLSEADVAKFYQLLELQRCSMFMFTSCGWFFDEISGLEAGIILRYAARAIQLAEQTGSPPLEPRFLNMLAKAPSNISEFGNGANVYLNKIRPDVVGKDRVIANYAIQSLARSSNRQYSIYCYDIVPQQEEDLGANPVPCLYGHVRVSDRRTLDQEDYLYAVIHFGGLDFRCSIRPYTDIKEYRSILKSLQQSVEAQNTGNMIRILDESLIGSFTLHDAFKDLRSSIAVEISEKTLGMYTDFQRHLYEIYRPLILSLRQWGIRVPGDLRIAIRRVLSDEVKDLVIQLLEHEYQERARLRPWQATDFFYRVHMGRLHSLFENAKSWGVSLQTLEAEEELGASMVNSLTRLIRNFTSGEAGRFFRIMRVCQDLAVKPELWKLQTLFFELIEKVNGNPKSTARIHDPERYLSEIDDFLECRFTRFLSKAEELRM